MVNVFHQRRERKRRREEQQRATDEHHDTLNTEERAAEPTGGVVALASPNAVGAMGRMVEFVNTTRKSKRRDNTAVAYDPKRHEFEHFCELNCDNNYKRFTVDGDKAYRFMFYQSFREKKKTGGRRKNKPPPFDQENYMVICGPFFRGTSLICEDLPKPQNPTQWSQFNTHRTVIKNLHFEQRSKGCNSNPWDIVWTMECKTLELHVKERIPEIKRITCAEKLDGEMAPCIIAEKFPNIEQELWNDSKNARGSRNVCSMLRHRCCCLYLTTGVLRSESAHGNDTSDFFGLRPPQKELDVHRMWLMINQIAEGKTTYGNKQWGRATRHKDVKLCSCGGTAIYLGHRILITGEFADMTVEQWMDNKHWFFIKFLIDTNGSDNTVPMSSDTCGSHIDNVLKRLHLPNNKKLHLGRNLGAKLLDLHEVDPEEVRRMGQWNQTVYDACYSSKLPMKSIRTLAGHSDSTGIYFNTRTTIKPPRELEKLTPFGFALDMREQLKVADVDGKKGTARGALDFFCDMATILLQDLAAMQLQPERDEHPLYDDFVFLNNEPFIDFKERMKLALEREDNPHDAKLHKVLPGVHQRLVANKEAISANAHGHVDNLCLDKGVQAPSYWNPRDKEQDFITKDLKAVCKAAFFMTDQDLATPARLKAHVRSWMPETWCKGFRGYMCAFAELLSETGTGGMDAEDLKEMSESYMESFKPKSEKLLFNKLIHQIRDGDDGEITYGYSDDEEAMQEEGADEGAVNGLMSVLCAAANNMAKQGAEEAKDNNDMSVSSEEHEFED